MKHWYQYECSQNWFNILPELNASLPFFPKQIDFAGPKIYLVPKVVHLTTELVQFEFKAHQLNIIDTQKLGD